MFVDFANVWTPVMLARNLRRKPCEMQLASVHIRLNRDHRGVVSAHRNHQQPTTQRGDFPVFEGGGLIWIYTALLESVQPPPPILPEALRTADDSVFGLQVTWQTHWTRVLENMMDNAHLTFVHGKTLGRKLRQNLRRESCLNVLVEPRDIGFYVEGMMGEDWYSGVHHFIPPNCVVIYMGFEGAPVASSEPSQARRAHVFCVPLHPHATRLMIVSNFGRWNHLARMFLPLNRYIVQEDKAIVESSYPAEVPPPGEERSVATDRATLRFRRYYHEHIKGQPTSAMPPDALQERSGHATQ